MYWNVTKYVSAMHKTLIFVLQTGVDNQIPLRFIFNMTCFKLLLFCFAIGITRIYGIDRDARILLEEASIDDIVRTLANLTARVEKCETGKLMLFIILKLTYY
jgi:hypothetical protein